MPELPDVEVYVDCLRPRLVGEQLERVRVVGPFLLRTVEPPLSDAEGRRFQTVRRLGKRLVFELEGELFLVLHLMIAGRLRWRARGAAVPRKNGLAAFDLPGGTLLLTEAGSKKRASLSVLRGEDALRALDRGGLEVPGSSLDEFRAALVRESHTLKRALSDPRLFSGIGNAYSDEILHRARLSPMQLTRKLDEAEVERLHQAALGALAEWTERLRRAVGHGFPEKVTAFHPDMAVHGRYRQPCPDCGSPVQRIRYAQNECNYCARCQTGGRVLADRALSRLLREDWPRTLEEWEELRGDG